MLIELPRRTPLTWQEAFDAQTAQFCKLSKYNRELQRRFQFVFYAGTLEERARILLEAEVEAVPRRPAGREESGVIPMQRRERSSCPGAVRSANR
jgi:hypothetical protein